MTSQAYIFVLLCPFVLAAAWQTETAWLYLIGAADLALLFSAWLLARLNARGIVATALVPAPGYQGSAMAARVRLTRTLVGEAHSLQVLQLAKKPGWRFRLWRSTLVPERGRCMPVPVVSPSTAGEVALLLDTTRRGEFPMPALHLQSAFPLGLVAVVRPLVLEGSYMVYPVAPRLEAVPWLAFGAHATGQSRHVTAGHGMMLRGVREYRPGDAWRQIHWRTMARRATPHVKETEIEHGEALVLFLDLRRSVHTEATLEHMITIAAAILAHCEAAGRPLKLVTQPEAEPQGPWPMGPVDLAWLARAQATAPDGPLVGPEGAILLSPAPAAGWEGWAGHFVYCPATPVPCAATVICPVGADIAHALGRRAA